MKKTAMFILTLILCVFLTGCEKKAVLSMPFTPADVNKVEMFHYIVPTSAEKRVITEPDDITALYTLFSGLEVSDKKTEPVSGAAVVSFRFHLADDAGYEIIYCAEAVKAGRLKLPEEQLDYFTSADIGGCWNMYQGYASAAVSESELPSYG
ncbi:MAG: hypothetical protein Q4G07_11405 [Oscillospiraceae bacterium]|nr:hypothetical protein [Oscillospiraceae bacterium]